jgi:hypothetical protein
MKKVCFLSGYYYLLLGSAFPHPMPLSAIAGDKPVLHPSGHVAFTIVAAKRTNAKAIIPVNTPRLIV